MRILITIPHYYRGSAQGFYGSLSSNRERRLDSLRSTLAALHQALDRGQGLLHVPDRCLRPSNGSQETQLEIAVCTTGGDHLVGDLPPGLCHHVATRAQPPLLGYHCHALLRDNLGRFDWYGYMEDDLVLSDPEFFAKLAWFRTLAGNDAYVLQPNRFEVADRPPVFRVYIDGTPNQEHLRQQINPDAPARIEASHLGRPIVFRQVANPHSGTFFLTDAQMRRWAAQPDFLDRSTAYIGALESAATLGLIRHFVVYKPARENAGFLEVHHADPRYLNRKLEFEAAPPHRLRVIQG